MRNRLIFVIFFSPFISAKLERTHLRLAGGGSEFEGRVEVFREGEWGTVCKDHFSKEAAEVVCRMLGFPTQEARTAFLEFGRGTGPIWLDNVRCEGTELDIAFCDRNPWNTHNCDHDEDVGVICVPRTNDTATENKAYLGSNDSTVLKPPQLNEAAMFANQQPQPPANFVPRPPGSYEVETPKPGPPSPAPPPLAPCNGHGVPSCTCDQGYTGANCENTIDWCDEPLPNYRGSSNVTMGNLCGNHGVCVSQQNGMKCLCKKGFSGEFCETDERLDYWGSFRCALYETPEVVDENIALSCPDRTGKEEPIRQHCIPDNLNCFYQNCEYPVGWCLPTSELDYEKLRTLAQKL